MHTRSSEAAAAPVSLALRTCWFYQHENIFYILNEWAEVTQSEVWWRDQRVRRSACDHRASHGPALTSPQPSAAQPSCRPAQPLRHCGHPWRCLRHQPLQHQGHCQGVHCSHGTIAPVTCLCCHGQGETQSSWCTHASRCAHLQGYAGDEELGAALTGADLVIIPAGVPRKPGMDRDDLFKTNASIIQVRCPPTAAPAVHHMLRGTAVTPRQVCRAW